MMDTHASEVLTEAIKQAQQAVAEQEHLRQHPYRNNKNGHGKRDNAHADKTEASSVPIEDESSGSPNSNPNEQNPVNGKIPQGRKSISHRTFALDPQLNVARGILPDVTGPRPKQIETFAENSEAYDSAVCTRCKKEFINSKNGKNFKLCPSCREQQRQRSRKWQQKTKETPGACRRCGIKVPQDQNNYVLCPTCRLSLRSKKVARYENGKCVHCSGENDSDEFKVCSRCRTNDKLRRKALEDRGCCNRCAASLKDEDGNHKVCTPCRLRKKNMSKGFSGSQNEGQGNSSVLNYEQQIARQHLEANLFAQ